MRIDGTDVGRHTGWLDALQSDAGDSVVSLSGLPSPAATGRPHAPGPLAVVMASASAHDAAGDLPMITYQSYGLGRVVVIEGAGMWRWAFLAPQHQQQHAVYTTLWQSLMRWLATSAALMPGRQYALHAPQTVFEASKPVTLTRTARADSADAAVPPVLIEADALAEPRTVSAVPLGDEPGAYLVRVGELPPGAYWARLAGAEPEAVTSTVSFEVRANEIEQLELRARPDVVERIATDTGGGLLSGGSGDEVVRAFSEYRERSHPAKLERSPAWDRWWVLIGVLTIWTTAWSLRRSGGLI